MLVAVALAVLAADIATKVIVVATLSDRAPIRLLGGLLTLRVDRNAGAAFSIGQSMTVAFSVIAAGVIIYILRTSRRIRSLAWAVALGLLLGGAAGNLTDRLFRSPGPLRGYAVDWIQVPHWPVFNLADSAIVCGGVLAVLLAARGIRIDGTRAGSPEPADEHPDSGTAGDPSRPTHDTGQAAGDTGQRAESTGRPDDDTGQLAEDAGQPMDGRGEPPGGGA